MQHAPLQPASVARRINGERLVVLGWPRAILMQVAHPLIAAGVAEHSGFRSTALAPVQRLHATVTAMLGLTFGTRAEQDRVVAHIRGIHDRVHGTLREHVGPCRAGTPYSAHDPALLLWVHATLIDTSVLLFEAAVGPLTTAQRHQYCAESAPVAIALGAAPGSVPRTWDDMQEYVANTLASGALAVGSDARTIAHALLASPIVRLSGPFAWAHRQLTLGLLPASLREAYGFSWGPNDQRRLGALLATSRRVRRWTPDLAARWRRA